MNGSSLATTDAGVQTPGQNDAAKCSDARQIRIAATIQGAGDSRSMNGTVTLADCASCQPITFGGTRQAFKQQKADQTLVPRVVTIIFQIAVIIIAVRAFGFLFKFINQPQVIGEMVAGILLGPSLLGWVAPHISTMLFPPVSLDYLNTISQIGIVIYMFLVGLALKPEGLKGHRHAAILTSHVSIVVPFLLGTLLAFYLYPRLSSDNVTLDEFRVVSGRGDEHYCVSGAGPNSGRSKHAGQPGGNARDCVRGGGRRDGMVHPGVRVDSNAGRVDAGLDDGFRIAGLRVVDDLCCRSRCCGVSRRRTRSEGGSAKIRWHCLC